MKMNYQEWINIGIENGFAGPAVCYTHDGLPTTELEDEEFSEGDPCIHVIRLYDSLETKEAVEKNHSPSIWRIPRK